MRIGVETPFLHAGENVSRTLNVEADAELVSGKEVRLALRAPSGRAYISPELTLTDGRGAYLLPACVLDRRGRLLAQLLIRGDGDFCLKSDIFVFEVYPGLDETCAEAETGELITLAGLDEQLRLVRERLNGLVPLTDAELAAILV